MQTDVVDFLRTIIPKGVWLHDRQDGNGDSHLKAGLVGLSETVPIIDGALGLSTWQNIFLCEFDGPRSERQIVCTVIDADRPTDRAIAPILHVPKRHPGGRLPGSQWVSRQPAIGDRFSRFTSDVTGRELVVSVASMTVHSMPAVPAVPVRTASIARRAG